MDIKDTAIRLGYEKKIGNSKPFYKNFSNKPAFITFVKRYGVIRKFFPLDKNYLLEEVQLSLQDTLLAGLIERVKQQYVLNYNPLLLNDELSKNITAYAPGNLKSLYPFYQNLAAVYRYKFGHNQLEILWDGRDHREKYIADWSLAFVQWTSLFCLQRQFLLAVFELTVFLSTNKDTHLSANRMNTFISAHFELKIHKHKGIVEMQVA